MAEPTLGQAAMPAVGDEAPQLELVADDGVTRSLRERRGGWTVVYFYPEDDTPGCTTEACEFRDANDEIKEHGAEVWGVSILGTASKAAFKRKFGLPFVLLADEDHRTAGNWGVWVEKHNYGRTYMGIQRATFLVDPQGRVARVWPKARSAGHAAEVLAALGELKAQPANVSGR